MKIDLGHGVYLEGDEEPRDTEYHRRIVSVTPIPNTRTGNWVDLECGHRVQAFGNLVHAASRVLCTQCRDTAQGGSTV